MNESTMTSKPLQKVEDDKANLNKLDKNEYEELRSSLSDITRCIITFGIIISGILIVALAEISYKIDRHNKACVERIGSLAKEVVIDLPMIQQTDPNATALLLESVIKQIDKQYSTKLVEIQAASDTRLSREMNNLNLWITAWALLMGIISIGLPMFLSHIDFKKREIEKRKLLKLGNHYKETFEEYENVFKAEINKATKEQKDLLEAQMIEVQGQSKIMFLLHLLSTLCNFSSTSFPESAERDQCVDDIVTQTAIAFDKIYQHCNQHKEYKPEISFHSVIVFLIISCDQIKIIFSNRRILRLLCDLINSAEELEQKFCKDKDGAENAHEEFLEALQSTNYALDSFKQKLKQYLELKRQSENLNTPNPSGNSV